MRKLPVKIPSWDETAEPSPTFMFAHVTLKPGMVDTFTEMLGDVAPIFREHRGWKLRGSYLQLEGSTDTDTAIDVWEVPGINAIVTNLNASREDAAYKKATARDARVCGGRSPAGDDQAAGQGHVGKRETLMDGFAVFLSMVATAGFLVGMVSMRRAAAASWDPDP